MNEQVASELISTELRKWRALPYRRLKLLISNPINQTELGSDGVTYQIETEALWDDEPGGNVRVTVSVDDGGFRSFVPLTGDFIVSPTGKFVDE